MELAVDLRVKYKQRVCDITDPNRILHRTYKDIPYVLAGFLCPECKMDTVVDVSELDHEFNKLNDVYDVDGILSHRTITCPHCKKEKAVRIDIQMIPAIEFMWSQGYSTSECCCSHKYGSIIFRSKCMPYIKIIKPPSVLVNWLEQQDESFYSKFAIEEEGNSVIVYLKQYTHGDGDEIGFEFYKLAYSLPKVLY